jgi:hypothetical protein
MHTYISNFCVLLGEVTDKQGTHQTHKLVKKYNNSHFLLHVSSFFFFFFFFLRRIIDGQSS